MASRILNHPISEVLQRIQSISEYDFEIFPDPNEGLDKYRTYSIRINSNKEPEAFALHNAGYHVVAEMEATGRGDYDGLPGQTYIVLGSSTTTDIEAIPAQAALKEVLYDQRTVTGNMNDVTLRAAKARTEGIDVIPFKENRGMVFKDPQTLEKIAAMSPNGTPDTVEVRIYPGSPMSLDFSRQLD